MKASDLYRWIADPNLLAEASLAELEQEVEVYPYFHTARLLYLKKLALVGDNAFVSKLERFSPGITDRKQLFLLVEGEKYGLSLPEKREKGEEKDDAFSLIDAFLSGHQGIESHSQKVQSQVDTLIQPSAATDYLHWLQSENEGMTVPSGEGKLRHQDLIDSFLEEDERRLSGRGPHLKVKDGEAKEPLDSTIKEPELPKPPGNAYFTETLARIYVKQKRYEKALQIIRNLSLKYPEKNIYFADQIRFLEKLIINTKK